MEHKHFRRPDRIRGQADFDRVHAEGKFSADRVLVVRGCRNNRSVSRLGLSVSRKAGGAVVRNRWKRLIREAFRTERHRIPIGIDFVVSPRKGASPDYAAIVESLPRLAVQVAKQIGVSRW